jgi:hypothetical protein
MRFTHYFNPTKRYRHALSFLEFLGCLVAMTGGVVLGSMYLGVDVKQTVASVLVQAQVVDTSYFGLAPEQAEQTAATEDISTEQIAEGNSVAPEIQNEDDSQVVETKTESEPTTANATLIPEPTAAETRTATRAYWDKLTECIQNEANGRLRGEGNPEEWQLYDYLLQRKKGHEQALVVFETLEPLAVDDRLVEHGGQVASWHKSGIKLFENALSLLSDGPGAKLTGPFAQSWQSAATQLRMEENLVLERHKAVANYLDREYAAEAPFVPAFQQQVTK